MGAGRDRTRRVRGRADTTQSRAVGDRPCRGRGREQTPPAAAGTVRRWFYSGMPHRRGDQRAFVRLAPGVRLWAAARVLRLGQMAGESAAIWRVGDRAQFARPSACVPRAARHARAVWARHARGLPPAAWVLPLL